MGWLDSGIYICPPPPPSTFFPSLSAVFLYPPSQIENRETETKKCYPSQASDRPTSHSLLKGDAQQAPFPISLLFFFFSFVRARNLLISIYPRSLQAPQKPLLLLLGAGSRGCERHVTQKCTSRRRRLFPPSFISLLFAFFVVFVCSSYHQQHPSSLLACVRACGFRVV